MLCPYCHLRKARVIDSRNGHALQARLRECPKCGQFATKEIIDPEVPSNWQRLAKLDRHFSSSRSPEIR
jgi:transcriptional regulator NrdR family protein